MPVTVRGTDILFNDGTTQSSAVGIPSSYSAVGSLVIAINGSTSNLLPGNTIAGSNLYVPNVIGSGSVGAVINLQGTGIPPYATLGNQVEYYRRIDGSNPGWVAINCTALSGTWRVLGSAPARTYFYDGTYAISIARASACLFQRIA